MRGGSRCPSRGGGGGDGGAQIGWTALMLAAGNGRVDCARLLLDAGADKGARNNVRASRFYAWVGRAWLLVELRGVIGLCRSTLFAFQTTFLNGLSFLCVFSVRRI